MDGSASFLRPGAIDGAAEHGRMSANCAGSAG